MGIVVKHVYPHPSTGRLSYRRVFPREIRPFVPGQVREVKRSLGARTLSEPGAMDRAAAAASEYEMLYTLARKAAAGTHDTLDASLIDYLTGFYLARELRCDEEARWGRVVERPYVGRSNPEEDYENSRELLEQRDLAGLVAYWRDWLLQYGRSLGYILDPSTEAFGELCRAFGDAACHRWLSFERHIYDEGPQEAEVPTEPGRPDRGTAAAVSGPQVPLLATFDAYAAAQGLTPGVRDEWRNYVAKLIAFLGHDDAAKLTAGDLRRWRDKLLVEPSQRGTRRSPVTVRDKYITAVRATLAWAVEESTLSVNVAAAVKVRVLKQPKLRDRHFTSNEARAILKATLVPVSGELSPEHVRARRWIPWLCAYTGGRVNEFSQLRGEDVREVDGVWTVRITPEAGTVKAKEARLVPLHPHLIEQGFLDMVRAQGRGPLFYSPERQRVLTDSNRHVKKVGERLAKWVREAVEITDPTLQPNHAWRHLFKSLSHGVMEERIADAIQGHAPKTTGRTYGKPPLGAMADAIDRFPRFEVPGA